MGDAEPHGALSTRRVEDIPYLTAATGSAADRRCVKEALDTTGGNKAPAVRRLGISRPALYRLIEKDEDAEAGPVL